MHQHNRTVIFLPCYQWIRDYFQLYEKSGGSVIDCLTRDRGVAGSSLVGATACVIKQNALSPALN